MTQTIASAEDAFALGSSIRSTIHPRRTSHQPASTVLRDTTTSNSADAARAVRVQPANHNSACDPTYRRHDEVRPSSDVTAEPVLRQRFGGRRGMLLRLLHPAAHAAGRG